MGVWFDMGVWWDTYYYGCAMSDNNVLYQPIHKIRLAAHAALKRWSIQDDNYKQMYILLGYDPDKHWPVEMTDRDVNILKMLAGPHGYAVYKALLARMKDD